MLAGIWYTLIYSFTNGQVRGLQLSCWMVIIQWGTKVNSNSYCEQLGEFLVPWLEDQSLRQCLIEKVSTLQNVAELLWVQRWEGIGISYMNPIVNLCSVTTGNVYYNVRQFTSLYDMLEREASTYAATSWTHFSLILILKFV